MPSNVAGTPVLPGRSAFQPVRKERRVSVALPLTLSGSDSSGTAFQCPATTVDVSRVGARVILPEPKLPVGSVVAVQYGTRKSRFRVVWLGRRGSEEEQLAGIRCIEDDGCPWSELLASGSSSSASVRGGGSGQGSGSDQQNAPGNPSQLHQDDPLPPRWPEADRRQTPRFACDFLIQVRRPEDAISISAKVTDISLRGCYLETMSPWAVGTRLEMLFRFEQAKFSVEGVVRTCHAAMGNGIEFTKASPEALQRLEKRFMSAPSSGPQAEPNAGTTGKWQEALHSELNIALHEQLEALIDLLEKKSVLTRAELLEVLRDNALRRVRPK